MIRQRLTGVTLLALLVLTAFAAPAAVAGKGKPEIERIHVDETFPDEFLTEACGVPVTTHAEGLLIIRTFPDDQTGLVEVTTVNLVLTATSGDNSYTFRDVGADLIRIEPDGTAVLMVIGQVPFGFIGVLKVDLETGEVILEPEHDLGGQLEEACQALTA
jgi:hypothetical protein